MPAFLFQRCHLPRAVFTPTSCVCSAELPSFPDGSLPKSTRAMHQPLFNPPLQCASLSCLTIASLLLVLSISSASGAWPAQRPDLCFPLGQSRLQYPLFPHSKQASGGGVPPLSLSYRRLFCDFFWGLQSDRLRDLEGGLSLS